MQSFKLQVTSLHTRAFVAFLRRQYLSDSVMLTATFNLKTPIYVEVGMTTKVIIMNKYCIVILDEMSEKAVLSITGDHPRSYTQRAPPSLFGTAHRVHPRTSVPVWVSFPWSCTKSGPAGAT